MDNYRRHSIDDDEDDSPRSQLKECMSLLNTRAEKRKHSIEKFDSISEIRSPTSLKDRISMFNTQAEKHTKNQKLNPFSGDKSSKDFEKRTFSTDEYGRPVKGSKTELRGHQAEQRVFKEILELCDVINEFGEEMDDEGLQKVILFGELFNIYTSISNKLVGVLLRARKHGLVDFEGEVLFQRRDDNVPIILLKPMKEIRAVLKGNSEEPE